MKQNAKTRTRRSRRTWIAGTAALAVIVSSVLFTSPASAGSADLRRTVWLGGSETQGGKACVARDIFLNAARYKWTAAVTPGGYAETPTPLDQGWYTWEACVVGVPGVKGQYYGSASINGTFRQIFTNRFTHNVGGNVEIVSTLFG
jgi:hypothetical protein